MSIPAFLPNGQTTWSDRSSSHSFLTKFIALSATVFKTIPTSSQASLRSSGYNLSAFEAFVPGHPHDHQVIDMPIIVMLAMAMVRMATTVALFQEISSITLSAILQNLWNYCNVLREDGISCGD